MKVITYSLTGENGSREDYYTCAQKLTDKVIEKANGSIIGLIKGFSSYIKETQATPERSGYEFVVEALGLGVFWRVYGEISQRRNYWLCAPLAGISKLRGKTRSSKPVLDFLKGIVLFFLYYPAKQKGKSAVPTVRQLKKLLLCLEAFGDFEQEVKRLKNWVDYFSGIEINTAYIYLSNLMKFADWFEAESSKHLQKYTYNVDSFIKEKYAFYRRREDFVFCLRKPVEYHLNMVGAELLSREYKKEFESSAHKMILLPACMRSHQDSLCHAASGTSGLICASCTPDCIVNKISCQGSKNGYEVYIVSHESSAFSGKRGCAVVGISCVTRLIEGGFKAKELGFAAQCVLLDYCGCKKHWDTQGGGIPTALNLSKLNEIMQVDVKIVD